MHRDHLIPNIFPITLHLILLQSKKDLKQEFLKRSSAAATFRHPLSARFEINLSSSSSAISALNDMMKAHDQNATSFQTSSSSAAPIYSEIHLPLNADDKKHRRNSQTKPDGIVCGLSINKDFLCRGYAEHWKDERCVYYTFFL